MSAHSYRHIRRTRPGWATGTASTHCGRAATGDAISEAVWGEAVQTSYGGSVRRSYSDFCVTCVDRASNAGDPSTGHGLAEVWVDHLRLALRPWRHPQMAELAERARVELDAVTILVDRHRDEYEQLVDAMLGAHDNVTPLRRGRRRR